MTIILTLVDWLNTECNKYDNDNDDETKYNNWH